MPTAQNVPRKPAIIMVRNVASVTPSCSSIISSSTIAASRLLKMPKYIPSSGLIRRDRGAAAIGLDVLVSAVPMVNGVLAVDERRDGNERNDDETVANKKISEREAEKAAAIQLVRIEWKHDQGQQKGDEARHHLPLRVPP